MRVKMCQKCRIRVRLIDTRSVFGSHRGSDKADNSSRPYSTVEIQCYIVGFDELGAQLLVTMGEKQQYCTRSRVFRELAKRDSKSTSGSFVVHNVDRLSSRIGRRDCKFRNE